MSWTVDFLTGKSVSSIEGLLLGSDSIVLTLTGGGNFRIYHEYDCCECFEILSIEGDVANLLNTPILSIVTEKTRGWKEDDDFNDSFTDTTQTFTTSKGVVTIVWEGASNGYHSERVDFDFTD